MSGHLDGPPPGPPDPPYIPGDLGAPSAKEFARRRAGDRHMSDNPYPNASDTMHYELHTAWDEGYAEGFAAGRAAATPDPPDPYGPRCAACGFGPMPAASPDERLREALTAAHDALRAYAISAPCPGIEVDWAEGEVSGCRDDPAPRDCPTCAAVAAALAGVSAEAAPDDGWTPTSDNPSPVEWECELCGGRLDGPGELCGSAQHGPAGSIIFGRAVPVGGPIPDAEFGVDTPPSNPYPRDGATFAGSPEAIAYDRGFAAGIAAVRSWLRDEIFDPADGNGGSVTLRHLLAVFDVKFGLAARDTPDGKR